MSRKQKLIFNTASGLTQRVVSMICGFLLPRYMLLYYGSTVNGLVSSITNFLSVISLLEMGVGPVIQSNLYKPLAENDSRRVSEIVRASNGFFHTIAYIFILYITILCFIFPHINKEFNVLYIVSLIVIIAISTFMQYFFGMTNQLLLNADQLAFIQISLQAVAVILNTALCITLIKTGLSVHYVKLITAIVFTVRPLILYVYVKKHYCIDKNIHLTENPIKQKWNGFAQHIAGFACGNTDIIVLTFFSSLSNVSVYSVYYSITLGLTQTMIAASTGLNSLFGNIIAKGEKEILHSSFEKAEYVIHSLGTIFYTTAGITAIPFVRIYTRGINDVNYIVPSFAFVMVLAYAFQNYRIPYARIIEAAGHFKQTQNASFISVGINITISIAVVHRLGLIGVAIGTLVAMLFETCFYAWYLKKNILKRPMKLFLRYLFTDFIIAMTTVFVSQLVKMDTSSYYKWSAYVIIIMSIATFLTMIVSRIVYRKLLSELITNTVGRLMKKIRSINS